MVKIPLTSVKVSKDGDGWKVYKRLNGDIRIYNDEKSLTPNGHCAPETDVVHSSSVMATVVREASFEASEYARIWHLLQDASMSTARQRLIDVNKREKYDTTPRDPWNDDFSPLYNSEAFRPDPVDQLEGGILQSDISGIDPSRFIRQRPASKHKEKFGELKSLCGRCLARFQASDQGNQETFISFAQGLSYVIYTH